MGAELPHFTDSLNRMVSTYKWRDERGDLVGYSSSTLAAELRRRGWDYSQSYIHQLRTGAKQNPAAVLLAGLCECFGGLDVRYWFDAEERIRILRDLDREMESL